MLRRLADAKLSNWPNGGLVVAHAWLLERALLNEVLGPVSKGAVRVVAKFELRLVQALGGFERDVGVSEHGVGAAVHSGSLLQVFVRWQGHHLGSVSSLVGLVVKDGGRGSGGVSVELLRGDARHGRGFSHVDTVHVRVLVTLRLVWRGSWLKTFVHHLLDHHSRPRPLLGVLVETRFMVGSVFLAGTAVGTVTTLVLALAGLGSNRAHLFLYLNAQPLHFRESGVSGRQHSLFFESQEHFVTLHLDLLESAALTDQVLLGLLQVEGQARHPDHITSIE